MAFLPGDSVTVAIDGGGILAGDKEGLEDIVIDLVVVGMSLLVTETIDKGSILGGDKEGLGVDPGGVGLDGAQPG